MDSTHPLHIDINTSRPRESSALSLVTPASQSPLDEQKQSQDMEEEEAVLEVPSVGQWTLTPTVKTTTTVTTTTTTTTYPPLVLKPPKKRPELDARQYPLRDAPTPTSLRSFSFELDGKVSKFEESGDPERSIVQLQESISRLQDTPNTAFKDPLALQAKPSESARAAVRQVKRPGSPLEQSSSDALTGSDPGSHKKRKGRTESMSMPVALVSATTPTRPAVPYAPRPVRVGRPGELLRQVKQEPTPTKLDDAADFDGAPVQQGTTPHEPVSPTSSAQPMSLPSPKMSPISAALARGGHALGYFDSKQVHEPEAATQSTTFERIQKLDGVDVVASKGTQAMMEIPTMLETFDRLPPNVQTYIMYHLLRRSNIKTLQFVAGVVNPTLQRDFLAHLPYELALQVLQYLDVRSLCRAAQVSKRWRAIVDSDEWTWKRLFEADGHKLDQRELDRAIQERWGMQAPVEAPEVVHLDEVPVGLHVTERANQAKRRTSMAEFADQLKSEGHEEPLPSQHLFKDIYRRHHVTRKTWMDPEGEPRHISFTGHGSMVVTCLQFDSEKIVSGSDDTCINVYDTATGALKKRLRGHEGGVWALRYEGNTLVSGSTDRTVRVWDIEKGECTQVFYGHTSTVRCLQIVQPQIVGHDSRGKPIFEPKFPVIVTGSRDSTLRVWKLPQEDDEPYIRPPPDSPGEAGGLDQIGDNPYHIRTLQGHTSSVRAVSAHGDQMVSGSYDTTVRVWRISTGECQWILRGHAQKVYSVVIDPKRQRCVSGSMDWIVKVWSMETGTCLWNLEGHTSLVGLLDLSADYLVSAAADSTLRVWDPESGRCEYVLSAHTSAITCFQHDEYKVVSGSDGTLKMWDIKTGRFVRDLLTGLSNVWQIRFDDRRCVAAVQRDNLTWIEVLDFGAAAEGVPVEELGTRMVIQDDEMYDEEGNALI
ncbi:SCF ubiquitin ligase complex subunit cdc4 [Saitoella coloradoensis]